MNRPTVLVITDEPEFSVAVTRRWLTERIVPSFILMESSSARDFKSEQFDLALVGGVFAQELGPVLDAVKSSGKQVIVVSRTPSPARRDVISVSEIQEWPDLIVALASQIFERTRAEEEVRRLASRNAQLERQASLGHYMIEAHHKLNNTLTSILGNSDLLMLDPEKLDSSQRVQIETIRNMAMRLNEIMQRFTSLQKEIQLVEQQAGKLVKTAAASAD